MKVGKKLNFIYGSNRLSDCTNCEKQPWHQRHFKMIIKTNICLFYEHYYANVATWKSKILNCISDFHSPSWVFFNRRIMTQKQTFVWIHFWSEYLHSSYCFRKVVNDDILKYREHCANQNSVTLKYGCINSLWIASWRSNSF